jgi:hypothetical protein
VAIARAAARIAEVGGSYLPGLAFADPDVVRTVDFDVRISAVLEPSPWAPLFRSYFLESIAALAITRAVSDAPPLDEERVADLLRGALDVLTPVCSPA